MPSSTDVDLDLLTATITVEYYTPFLSPDNIVDLVTNDAEHVIAHARWVILSY